MTIGVIFLCNVELKFILYDKMIRKVVIWFKHLQKNEVRIIL